MDEAERIINNACGMAMYHGTTTTEVVDQILDMCGGQVTCRGHLREFEFTKITNKSYGFLTVDWYEKHHGSA